MNRAFTSFHGKSLEIALTVPLTGEQTSKVLTINNASRSIFRTFTGNKLVLIHSEVR